MLQTRRAITKAGGLGGEVDGSLSCLHPREHPREVTRYPRSSSDDAVNKAENLENLAELRLSLQLHPEQDEILINQKHYKTNTVALNVRWKQSPATWQSDDDQDNSSRLWTPRSQDTNFAMSAVLRLSLVATTTEY
ncbi:hypothetical protein Y032_0007g3222 [Ancylostoma ceylanicum]|uniref:Uncharacterized protein n=1 Tax=Ancylostoma ceylanicum TaxID=53326 RepID=A0A016VN36_9BILA|nr:hypothetical protein Y032_0007g3222 [Ancylostoma ceylanicum]